MRALQTIPASVPGPRMCSKQCKCLIEPWWHGQCPPCSCPSSLVYDANLSQDLRRCCFWESGGFSAAVSKLWPILESSINYCVSQRELHCKGGPPLAGETLLDSRSFNWCRRLGLLLDRSHPVKRPPLWSKYNSQRRTHKNPGARQGRFFLVCELVAVETDNKGRPSTSGIMVEPLFSGLTPVWIRVIRAA